MNNSFNLKIATLMFAIYTQLFAQADVKLSSYFFTPLTYNPAYAGSYEGMTFSGVYSSQWLGFEGAPETLLLSGHGTFFNSNTGLGFDVVNDKIGATKETKVMGNYAYHFNLNEKWKVALGIKAGFDNYTIDYRMLSIENPEEFNGSSDIVNNVNFNFGSGFYLHNEYFFFGIGTPNFLSKKYIDSYKNTLSNSTTLYYVTSGYTFEIDKDIYLQPNLMTRLSKGESQSTMFALNLNWFDKFYGSLNLELNNSAGLFAGFRFLEKYMVGYSYDTSINNTFSNNNNGTHTFFLNFRLDDYWERKRSYYSF